LRRPVPGDITVVKVDALGNLVDPDEARYHLLRKYLEKYSTVSKIEIVCRDDEVDRFVEVIRDFARTGERGDGRVFVGEIVRTVQIRTGKEGEEAL